MRGSTIISELMCGPHRRIWCAWFLLQDRLKGLAVNRPRFRHVHVVGAGVMGGDIAAWAVLRGMTVSLQDRSVELINRQCSAPRFFDKRLGTAGRCGRPCAAADGRAGRRGGGGRCLIEAIVESVDAKRALTPNSNRNSNLPPYLPPTPRASDRNLSRKGCATRAAWSASIFQSGGELQLWKIVQGIGTQSAVVQDALRFTRKLDKLPCLAKARPASS